MRMLQHVRPPDYPDSISRSGVHAGRRPATMFRFPHHHSLHHPGLPARLAPSLDIRAGYPRSPLEDRFPVLGTPAHASSRVPRPCEMSGAGRLLSGLPNGQTLDRHDRALRVLTGCPGVRIRTGPAPGASLPRAVSNRPLLRSPMGRGVPRTSKWLMVKRLPRQQLDLLLAGFTSVVRPYLKRSIPGDLKYRLPLWLPTDQDVGNRSKLD
jgi:hypothetical protein